MHVYLPRDIPHAFLAEIRALGAEITLVDGLITDCAKLVKKGADEGLWFDLSTLKEPYRVEGKKMMGYELAEQMNWRVPDVIVYPTGGGTGIVGIWKAFAEMEALGWIGSERPRMISVQSAGCAPIVRAFEQGVEFSEPWENAATAAAGIRVSSAVGDFLMLRAVRESGGFAVAVADDAILAARDEVARAEGLLLCPECAATFAAYRQEIASGRVRDDESVVLFNCASGLKYDLPEAGIHRSA